MKSETERLYLHEKAMNKQRFIEDAIASIESAGIRKDLIEELQKELEIAKKEVKEALQELDHKSSKSLLSVEDYEFYSGRSFEEDFPEKRK